VLTGHSPTKPAGECELVCVDPAHVHLVWPLVSGLIEAAMRRGDFSSFAAVRDAVLGGDALLWLAWDGTEIAAAAVTELAATEWRKVCVVVACGGSTPASAGAGMRRWIGLLEKIEEFARAEGCAAVRIIGRAGWARVLRDYRTKRVVLEKHL
jgi:hypothetical protein